MINLLKEGDSIALVNNAYTPKEYTEQMQVERHKESGKLIARYLDGTNKFLIVLPQLGEPKETKHFRVRIPGVTERNPNKPNWSPPAYAYLSKRNQNP